ncbi:MAG: hypothetical protein IKN18_00160 [Neisseriaceae bacterium]|nr:hypothetical protein [Neisseriaceae bacterium]
MTKSLNRSFCEQSEAKTRFISRSEIFSGSLKEKPSLRALQRKAWQSPNHEEQT